MVPGSLDFNAEQSYLQPPEEQTDIVHVIKGVIEAETGAIEHYNKIIEFTDGMDPVTNDMVIAILRDEEGHRASSRASCASTRPRAWRSGLVGRVRLPSVRGESAPAATAVRAAWPRTLLDALPASVVIVEPGSARVLSPTARRSS